MKKLAFLLLALPLALLGHAAHADDEGFALTIKDHVFTPATLDVPAGKKFKLRVKNLDATPEEFESSELRREKIIPAGAEVMINIGPLKPGTYRFEGEFNPKTAQGTLVAK